MPTALVVAVITFASVMTIAKAQSAAMGLCTNACHWPTDAICDDGGPGHMTDVCDLGTDCEDCGIRCEPGLEPREGACVACEREGAVQFSTTVRGVQHDCQITQCQPGMSLNEGLNLCLSPGAALCTNSCSRANDGECDDGGPGYFSRMCLLGSDCADCGIRCEPGLEPREGACVACEREGAVQFSTTVRGCQITQCQPGMSLNEWYNVCEGPGCTNSCGHAGDGDCDDGGPGSDWSSCDYGTDCADCGIRCEPGLEPREGACVACEREGAVQFSTTLTGCQITQCQPGLILNERLNVCDGVATSEPTNPPPHPNPNPNPHPHPDPNSNPNPNEPTLPAFTLTRKPTPQSMFSDDSNVESLSNSSSSDANSDAEESPTGIIVAIVVPILCVFVISCVALSIFVKRHLKTQPTIAVQSGVAEPESEPEPALLPPRLVGVTANNNANINTNIDRHGLMAPRASTSMIAPTPTDAPSPSAEVAPPSLSDTTGVVDDDGESSVLSALSVLDIEDIESSINQNAASRRAERHAMRMQQSQCRRGCIGSSIGAATSTASSPQLPPRRHKSHEQDINWLNVDL